MMWARPSPGCKDREPPCGQVVDYRVEEMLRLCLAAYEEALYERAHQQMLADGVLVSMPAPPLLPGETEEGDDFEPVELPGKPLSEIILEDRR